MSRAGLRCPVVEDFPLAVLEPAGVLGRATAPVLRQALAKVLTARPDVVLLDVPRLRVEDDLVLTVFAALKRRCEAEGAMLVVCGPPPALAAALSRVAVCRLVATSPSVGAALADVARHPVPRRRHAFLLPLTSSVPRARAVVEEACLAWGIDELVGPVLMVTGELVTNAVRHAGTEIGLSVELGRYYVIVAVRDGRPTLPRLRTPDPETGGRGLLIVEGLCASWGSAPTVTGKIVWGTLRRPGAGLRPAAAARRR
ncbi:STAS domain-containing protein [Dactylosporangium sp. McL0621]|uniref:STAS domain-containing protein n=1 Tax=Dactylosporangium sp. McL0621 TaxID=3415678 RepID=UPI003CF7B997